MTRRLVVAITGASGAAFGVRALEGAQLAVAVDVVVRLVRARVEGEGEGEGAGAGGCWAD